jgi:hypothetical protein
MTSSGVLTPTRSTVIPVREHINSEVASLLASFPNPGALSAVERRGIIARYTAVLEGNFIYWMTGALLSVRSEEARAKILENLQEEVRDCHPGMMRRFAIAANAVPTEADAAAVYQNLSSVRLFIGKLSAVPILITMAFFEGFIQQFMPYLADLAQRQGSADVEYTDVHGICDIGHTEELWRALDAEIALGHQDHLPPASDLFAGVERLRALIADIVTV